MRIINLTSKKELADNLASARGILKRMKGLLGRDSMAKGEALLIKPCSSVHTIGMRFTIDVIFLDKKNNVIAVKKNMQPNRLSSLYLKASSAIELPAGTIEATATKVGDRIKIQ